MPGAGILTMTFLVYGLSFLTVAFPGVFADDIFTLEMAQANLDLLKAELFDNGALIQSLSDIVSDLPRIISIVISAVFH